MVDDVLLSMLKTPSVAQSDPGVRISMEPEYRIVLPSSALSGEDPCLDADTIRALDVAKKKSFAQNLVVS